MPRCGLRGGRVWRGGRTGGGSGWRSRRVARARTRPGTAVCPRRWDRGGSRRPAACHHNIWRRRRRCLRGGTCRSSSARRSRGSRAQGHGVREIARGLGRAPQAVSRELRRNAATRSGGLVYRATTAQWHAERAARRPKAAKLATSDALRRYVEDRLAGRIARPDGTLLDGPRTVWRKRRHGPRQARRWARAWSDLRRSRPGFRIDFPEDEAMRISHEAIDPSLYVQGRGAARGAS